MSLRPWEALEDALLILINEERTCAAARRAARDSFCSAFNRTVASFNNRAVRLGAVVANDGRSRDPERERARDRHRYWQGVAQRERGASVMDAPLP